MNWGLMAKTIREVWMVTILFAIGVAIFESMLTYILPTYFDEFAGHILEIKFVRNIITALLGSDVGDKIGPTALLSFSWVHPLLLTLLWGHEITLCTRTPAGEIDRGTVDILLGLPVSRWQIYISETIIWLGSGLMLILIALVAHLSIRTFIPEDMHLPLHRIIVVAINLYCLYIAVGGVVWLVSALSDRLGKAMGISFAMILASMLLDFIITFWEPAKSIEFLSVLDYYRPWQIFQSDTWPIQDMLTLTAIGLFFWLAGAWVFIRRDVCTV